METEAAKKKEQERREMKGRLINRIDYKLKECENIIGCQVSRKEMLEKNLHELREQKKVLGENIKSLSGQLDKTPQRKLKDEELKDKCHLQYKISKLRDELYDKLNKCDECAVDLKSTIKKMQSAILGYNYKKAYKSKVLTNKIKNK